MQMESSHPEVVAELLVHAAAMFPVGPDGKVRSVRSGKTYWQPRLASAQMTEAFSDNGWGAPSAAAECCRRVDAALALGQPYCAGVSCCGNLILTARHRQPRQTRSHRFVRRRAAGGHPRNR